MYEFEFLNEVCALVIFFISYFPNRFQLPVSIWFPGIPFLAGEQARMGTCETASDRDI